MQNLKNHSTKASLKIIYIDNNQGGEKSLKLFYLIYISYAIKKDAPQ